VEQGSADVLVSAGPDWTKEQTYAGILALYRDLIHLRRNCQDTTRGLLGHRVNVQRSGRWSSRRRRVDRS